MLRCLGRLKNILALLINYLRWYSSRVGEILTHTAIVALLVLLAITTVYYPEFRVVIFAAFIATITLVVFISRRTSKRPPKFFEAIADEVRHGDVLFEVDDDEVARLLEKDFALYEELRKQSVKGLLESFVVVAIFAWYFIYFYLVLPRLVITETTLKLVAYLIGFITPYIFYVISEILFKSKTLTYVLRGYEVFDKGLISSSQYIVIKFPLSKDYVVREYSRRKCVELSKKHKGYVVRFLLYTKNTPKLTEILNNYGRAEVLSD